MSDTPFELIGADNVRRLYMAGLFIFRRDQLIPLLSPESPLQVTHQQRVDERTIDMIGELNLRKLHKNHLVVVDRQQVEWLKQNR